MRPHRTLLALLAGVAAVTLTACGDDDGSAATTSEVPTVTTPDTTPESTAPEPAPDTSVPSVPGDTFPFPSTPPDEILEAAEELLVGQTESAAEQAAAAEGWGFRVVRRDGESLPVTMDFRPDRVNVEVTDGVVTAVVNLG